MSVSDIAQETGFLRQIPLLANLTPEQDRAWSAHCIIETVMGGTTLYDPERPDLVVLLIVTGIIRAT